MTNLLTSELAESEIAGILESVPRKPLLPPLGSIAWRRMTENSIIQNWMKPIRERGGQECLDPLPILTDELYADFHRTGVRRRFEAVYFERRRRLARAAMCALLDDDAREKWIESLTNKVRDISNEVSWALPAHVDAWALSTEACIESGKDPMVIDLFAAETANLLGEMLDIFGKVLPANLQEDIRRRLRAGIFDNYIARYEDIWWTKDFCTHNWNAVCHQGVVGAALGAEEDSRRLAKIIGLACRPLRAYLTGFGEDGGCSEGPGYWSYGFGWFSVLNEQLEKRSAGRLSFFDHDRHILQIAKYGPRVSLPFFNLVNFADAASNGVLGASTLAYLGKRLNDESCRRQAYINYQYHAKNGLGLDDERQNFFHLARLFLYCPGHISEIIETFPEDFYFSDLEVLIAHGRDRNGHWWDFAAKAGNNAEHHNHNDCGSYILNIDGKRIICEIGAPEYVKDFFSERRYEFLAARTLGHSLPVINGHEQAAGKLFKSNALNCKFDDHKAEFSLDATQCYPEAAGCRRYARHFYFDKAAGRLEVRDEIELTMERTVETAMITHGNVVLRGGKAFIDTEGVTLRISTIGDTVVDRIEKHSYDARNEAGKQIQRLVFSPARMKQKVTLEYFVELQE